MDMLNRDVFRGKPPCEDASFISYMKEYYTIGIFQYPLISDTFF